MSSKLDKPLDDIVSAKRQSARNRRSTQRRSTGPKTTAPVGGVQKNSRPARGTAAKPAPAKAAGNGESKVIVSNLVCVSIYANNKPVSCNRFGHDSNDSIAKGCLGAADQGMFPLKVSFLPGYFGRFLRSPHPSFIPRRPRPPV